MGRLLGFQAAHQAQVAAQASSGPAALCTTIKTNTLTGDTVQLRVRGQQLELEIKKGEYGLGTFLSEEEAHGVVRGADLPAGHTGKEPLSIYNRPERGLWSKHIRGDQMSVSDPLNFSFVRVLREARHLRISEAFDRLLTLGACAMNPTEGERIYKETAGLLDAHDLKVLTRAFGALLAEMERHPYQDLLGLAAMEISHQLDKKEGGEFFTPHPLSAVLAALGGLQPKVGQILNVTEPAAGMGGMVLAAVSALLEQRISPLSVRWQVQDISPINCYGAFINLTVWGIPATVVCGDTLSNDVRWTWANPFWHLAQPSEGSAYDQLLSTLHAASASESALSKELSR